MGARGGRTTKRLEHGDLIALAKKSIVADDTVVQDQEDDPFADWNDQPEVAAGSQSNALPTTSRTATLADPLTTGLLAEVARRTSTMEIDPATIEAARRSTQTIDPEALAAALREAERTPVPTEPVHANTRRRR